MSDLEITNMLANYHKECDAAETIVDKAQVQLKYARLIRAAFRVEAEQEKQITNKKLCSLCPEICLGGCDQDV